MPDIQITEMSPAEIRSRLAQKESALAMHRDAVKAGMRFGAYLELLNPSEKDDPLDAYGRQLKEAGIITHSNPAAGYWASLGSESFFADGDVAGRALFPEFFAREWQRTMHANRHQRAILLSSDSIVGGWDRPFADAQTPRWQNMIEPAIPLSELVAVTTPIRGEDYRTIYMTYDAEAVRLFRVGESAEIPMTTLTDQEHTLRLRKYGRGLRASYEQLRRMRIDRLAWVIRWMAVQAEIDKVANIIDVAVNGDGNSNTAATEYNQSDLDDQADPGVLTLKGWLAFRLKFAPPYMLTTALLKEADALQLILLDSGSANVPLVNLTLAGIPNRLTPINSTADSVRYGWTEEAPTGKIVGLDARMAIEHVQEIGADITETERFITNQTQVIVMTEVENFAVLDQGALKILDLEPS